MFRTYPWKTAVLAAFFLFLILSSSMMIARSRTQPSQPPELKINWAKYLNSVEMLEILNDLERRYPQLAKVQVIGKSYLGKDLHLMEITNQETGPALSKPAIYIDGNMHTGEQTGAMLTLYLINHLLANYGKDAQATRLVDTRTFYLRPKFEVDASDWWLSNPGDTDYGGSVHPRDNDLDGRADEDPPEDLNGDGFVTSMRIKSPFGEWKTSEKDPRVMAKKKENELGGTYYLLLTEGIDNDGDGQFNEDGLGGINLSHNFSWGNLNREQIQSSPYTFSEPEAQATVNFWMDHPNIGQAVDLHTSGSFDELLYFPGGDEMPSSDLELYKRLATAYAQFTNREEVLPLMTAFPQPIWKLGMGDPEPFMYYNLGILGWCEELWGDDYANPFLRKYDKNNDKKISQDELLDFLNQEAEGKGFVPWQPLKHPQLGDIEVGGFVEKFCNQNPPPNLLERELRLKAPWYLYLAEILPQVKIAETKVAPLDGNARSLKVTVENQGFLPTNITEWAIKTGLAKSVVVKIEPKNAVLLEGTGEIRLGNIPGNDRQPGNRSLADNKRTAAWILKKTGGKSEIILTVISEKAGSDSKRISLD
jgi:hypothetical protein